jgi:hypothetical protein
MTHVCRRCAPVQSVFTRALLHGLATGEAALGAGADISLDELYDYIYARFQRHMLSALIQVLSSGVTDEKRIFTRPGVPSNDSTALP